MALSLCTVAQTSHNLSSSNSFCQKRCYSSGFLFGITDSTTLTTKNASSFIQKRESSNGVPRRTIRAAIGLGGPPKSDLKVEIGDKIRVTAPLKVYHVPKVKEFDLEGKEGILKDILGTWKGIPVSANLPYKVQFFTQVNEKEVKFFTHLQEGEFEVVNDN